MEYVGLKNYIRIVTKPSIKTFAELSSSNCRNKRTTTPKMTNFLSICWGYRLQHHKTLSYQITGMLTILIAVFLRTLLWVV